MEFCEHRLCYLVDNLSFSKAFPTVAFWNLASKFHKFDHNLVESNRFYVLFGQICDEIWWRVDSGKTCFSHIWIHSLDIDILKLLMDFFSVRGRLSDIIWGHELPRRLLSTSQSCSEVRHSMHRCYTINIWLYTTVHGQSYAMSTVIATVIQRCFWWFSGNYVQPTMQGVRSSLNNVNCK